MKRAGDGFSIEADLRGAKMPRVDVECPLCGFHVQILGCKWIDKREDTWACEICATSMFYNHKCRYCVCFLSRRSYYALRDGSFSCKPCGSLNVQAADILSPHDYLCKFCKIDLDKNTYYALKDGSFTCKPCGRYYVQECEVVCHNAGPS